MTLTRMEGPLTAANLAAAPGPADHRNQVDSSLESAEEEGFEPTVPLRVRRFSKPVP